MQPASQRNWKIRSESCSDQLVQQLSADLHIDVLTARVMALRGIANSNEGETFLAAKLSSLPDPDLLPGMATACTRLEQALQRGEKIAVHGDYDVDGITGCALLVETLRDLGAEVEYHIPLRLQDGYGLSAGALKQAAADGCSLVLSVDCGVTAVAEAALARELGIDLIITDHHQPPSELPDCLALVNPHLAANEFPWPDLSGVGVAFFLLAGLRRRLREQGFFSSQVEPDLRTGLDLVALGTIADMVPLIKVNRTLVQFGLPLISATKRPGLKALKRVAAVNQVSSGSVGFHLAPRLNAAGRLEDAALGVELLIGGKDHDPDELAELLDGFNQERRDIEQRTLEAAIDEIDNHWGDERYSLVLASEDWHPGVIGIVASRLVERYHRPTVLFALDGDQGKGSARSISHFHLYRALEQCANYLTGFGGHAMAAGMTLTRDQLEAFRTAFEQVARMSLTSQDLVATHLHDGEIELSSLDLSLLRELGKLAPFGIGNPQPVFVSRGCRVIRPRVVAATHLKFNVEQNGYRIDCIAFGQARRLDELSSLVDLLYRVEINEWRGQKMLQLQVIDFRSA